jgi:hypothetical protein
MLEPLLPEAPGALDGSLRFQGQHVQPLVILGTELARVPLRAGGDHDEHVRTRPGGVDQEVAHRSRDLPAH